MRRVESGESRCLVEGGDVRRNQRGNGNFDFAPFSSSFSLLGPSDSRRHLHSANRPNFAATQQKHVAALVLALKDSRCQSAATVLHPPVAGIGT